MSTEYEAVYLPTAEPDTFESTPLSNAGWYAEGQHGGALAALIVHQVEKVPTLTAMEIARTTIEMFRVVPVTRLKVDTDIVREGKRLQTLQTRVTGPDGTLLSIALTQRLRVADRTLPEEAATEQLELSAPEDNTPTSSRGWGIGEIDKPMFHRDAIEIREIHGGFSTVGPGAVWIRPRIPVVAGNAATPAQRAVIAADFCNGISRKLDVGKWVFMNSDLTIHIGRYPVGEWIALDARSSYSDQGRGVATGVLWDSGHWVGRSTQTLFLDHGETLSD